MLPFARTNMNLPHDLAVGCLNLVLLCLTLLHPAPLVAHTAEHLRTEATEAIGVDERLGTRIPLDLRFLDESGTSVRLGDLMTGPTLILPVFYGCTNVCNYLQGGVAITLKSIERQPGRDYRVISVSFDEHETPELAARSKRMYLAAMGTPFPADGWRFLTGDSATIKRLTDAIGYRFKRRDGDFIHPVASLVVAQDGTIVRYLYGVTILPKDLALALAEAKKGIAGASIRKMVEYCFSFDPVGKTYVFNLLRIGATVVLLFAGGFLAYLFHSGRKR